MLRFADRIVQTGVFRSGTPSWVSLFSGVATPGYQTVADVAAAESWQQNDTVGLLVVKDENNLWLGEGNYLSDGDIELVTESFSTGSIADMDDVTVSIVPIASHVHAFMSLPQGDGAFVGTFTGWDSLENHLPPPPEIPEIPETPTIPEQPETLEKTEQSVTAEYSNRGDTLYLSRDGAQAVDLPPNPEIGYEVELIKQDHELFISAPFGEDILKAGPSVAKSASVTPTNPVIVRVKLVKDGKWVVTGAALGYDTPDPRVDPHFEDVELLLNFEGAVGGRNVADSSLNQHVVNTTVDPAGQLENTDQGVAIGNTALLASPSTLPGAPGTNLVSVNMQPFDLGTDDFVIEMFFTPTEEVVL